jgi:hypothetical protein
MVHHELALGLVEPLGQCLHGRVGQAESVLGVYLLDKAAGGARLRARGMPHRPVVSSCEPKLTNARGEVVDERERVRRVRIRQHLRGLPVSAAPNTRSPTIEKRTPGP